MPKERKQRGRRKKKTEEDAAVEAKVEEQPYSTDEQHDYDPEGEASANFFGLLDESEQTYFKTIDDAMIADEFPSTEERDIFVQNVYQEAEGKELKLATSPLGSKVLEQLLARSTHEQIRRLFKTFQGNFMTLIRQRYASHVCEMLFAIAATVVSSEMAQASSTVEADTSDEPYVSTENLFLYMFDEVSGEIAALGADLYASHVVRDTLLVLNGSLFTFEEAKGQAKRYHGQKKYSWARPSRHMPTPSSFTEALKAVMEQLSYLPAAQLRMTASQPYSVSFIQVLVVLEASLKPEDKRPLLNSLLGDNHLEERDDYVESILREPSGSKLCETIVSSVSPAQFVKFYQTYFAGRAAKFAHNPITNFVLQKVMATTSDKAIVEDMTKELSPILRDLVELNHIQIIQRLVEANLRCQSETQGLMDDISVAFSCDADQNLVSKILATPVATTIEDADRPPRRSAAPSGPTYNIQGVFLVIALMNLPERQSAVIINSILETPGDELISYAKSHAAIKILTSFLTTDRTTVIQKKQLLNPFFGHFVELACDTTASHFVDTCWAGTANIKLYKDRIAQELLEKADDVRGHYYGRLVWRNWHMDQFKNKRGEWNYIVKQAGLKKASAPRQPPMIPDETHGNGNGTTDEPRPAMNAQRAAMMMDEGTKRAKKKLKRKEVVTDEVDDIFKKRKV